MSVLKAQCVVRAGRRVLWAQSHILKLFFFILLTRKSAALTDTRKTCALSFPFAWKKPFGGDA